MLVVEEEAKTEGSDDAPVAEAVGDETADTAE